MWWGGFLVIGTVLFGPSLSLFCFKAPTYDEDEDEEVEKILKESPEKKLKKDEYKENNDVDGEKLLKKTNDIAEIPVKK